jgi:type IV pilus assembly protein PilM
MLFTKRNKSTVGLDVGANSIKLVRLDRGKTGLVVGAIGIRELPPEAIVSDEVKDRDAVIYNIQSLIDQIDPGIKEVVVSVSGYGVITDKFMIDKKSGSEAEQAILFEAEQRSPFDVEDVTMNHHIIRVDEESKKQEILLVAARNEFLNSFIELILDCGLQPRIVDADSLAALNAYCHNYEVDPERTTVLLNMGYDVSNVVYLNDGYYHSTRDISSGTREIYNAIQKEFRLNAELAVKAIKGDMKDSIDQDMLKATIISASEELISGLELAFSYFKTQAKVEKLDWMVLAGGGALVPYLPEYLQSKLNIPLEILNPLRNIDYDPEMFQYLELEKIAPILTVPVGLAMRMDG